MHLSDLILRWFNFTLILHFNLVVSFFIYMYNSFVVCVGNYQNVGKFILVWQTGSVSIIGMMETASL